MKNVSLVRKYALAFTNYFGQPLSDQQRKNVQECSVFFVAHEEFSRALELPGRGKQEKEIALNALCDKFNLDEKFKDLCASLVMKSRISLLPSILQKILVTDYDVKGMEEFVITSSHEIDSSAQEKIKNFIASNAPTTPLCSFRVDPAILSGIRIQSQTRLWERSIEKELRTIYVNLTNQGMI